MQDEEKTGGEEVITVPVEETVPPVIEVPITEPLPEPLATPEPVPETITEPVAEPVVESLPEIIPEPEAVPEAPVLVPEAEPVATAEETPPVAPPPPPVVVEPVAPKAEPEAVKSVEEKPVEPPAPIPEAPKEQGGIPQKVLDLTPEELHAAHRLWMRANIRDLQKLSSKNRHQKLQSRLDEIESFVHANAPVKLSKVAYELNISEPNASNYLITLTKAKRIKATGSTTSRRYS